MERALARRTLGERGRDLPPAPGRRHARQVPHGRTGEPSRARRRRRPPRVRDRGEPLVIRFEGLGKSYGDLVAVDRITFEIEAGRVFGFIGRNGAGKTTTIKMMMGLLEPTTGTAVLGGHDIRTSPREAKAITGYLPDHPYLYDKLTGRELLHFVAGLYGVAPREREERADELLRDFALEDRAGELTETYSHGMKQRLALAGALIHRPRILVLDEPMVGLDPQGALDLRRLLARLASEGVTIFLSTHSLPV
ncbi:MAG: ABC transporter ATP-binding protein, partial [Deltaproteobacteria bacterium]|nr:ABC transporter ATP-binding protein [Deltaproteobacteria bacterium]